MALLRHPNGVVVSVPDERAAEYGWSAADDVDASEPAKPRRKRATKAAATTDTEPAEHTEPVANAESETW